MSDWIQASIDECADILDHMRVPVNEEQRSQKPGYTPYYGANGIQGFIDGWIFNEPLILMAEDGGYFDQFETRPVAYKIKGKSWVNNHAHILRPKEGYDFDFVFYSLEHKNVLPFIKGGTRAKLNQKELRSIVIGIPKEVNIQKKISKILVVLDQAIEKTEALIHKYKQIKAGLMHDLFARGLTTDGKLRSPRKQAPELYQETPIGWIPKEWAVMDCASIFDIDSGITLGAHRRPGKNPYPYLRVANVFREEIRTDEILKLEASETEIQQYGLRKYDLLLVEGHANVREIGRCAMVIDNAEGLLFQNHLFRLRSVSMDPYYSLYCLNSHYARKYWEGNCSTSSGLNTINRRMLGNMMLCVPELKEQEAVAMVLNAQNFHIGAEKQNLAKIKKLKSGLMHDLLTGRVQVKVD